MITPMTYKDFAGFVEECKSIEEKIIAVLEANAQVSPRAVATVLGQLLSIVIVNQSDPEKTYKQITERIRHDYRQHARKLGKKL